jgi:hypothetical protein
VGCAGACDEASDSERELVERVDRDDEFGRSGLGSAGRDVGRDGREGRDVAAGSERVLL